LEAQLETEHDERTHLLREKHELERRLNEVHSNGLTSKADQSKIQALKRELKKARALLHDAQTALDRAQKDNNPSRAIIRQLKNQVCRTPSRDYRCDDRNKNVGELMGDVGAIR
jgi:chromosome segregation ATPase